jgi:hypothetical protein
MHTDIAFDRFRCFDKPSADCNVAYAGEILLTLFVFTLIYLFFRAIYYAIDGDEVEPCVNILQTVDEELDSMKE